MHTDTRNKTEVVLLITPRVVRNIGMADGIAGSSPAGVDASPGAAPLRLRSQARVAMPISTGGTRAAYWEPTGAPAAPPGLAALALTTSGRADAGGTVSVTLQNRSGIALKGELEFDASMLQSAQGGGDRNGRWPFQLAAGAEQAFVLRALPAAEGKTTSVTAINLGAAEASGEQPMVQLQGDGQIAIGKR
jgi:general secretion pathway protein D